MILPLRRVHRAAFAALALLLPAVLASAWRARRPAPVQALAPELLPGAPVRAADAPLGDVLLYWSARAAAPGDALPADAELAGAVRHLAGAAAPPGKPHALRYDLAHGAIVPGGAP